MCYSVPFRKSFWWMLCVYLFVSFILETFVTWPLQKYLLKTVIFLNRNKIRSKKVLIKRYNASPEESYRITASSVFEAIQFIAILAVILIYKSFPSICRLLFKNINQVIYSGNLFRCHTFPFPPRAEVSSVLSQTQKRSKKSTHTDAWIPKFDEV